MLKYLLIILDDGSPSFCHYENKKNESNIMPLEILNDGIRFGMKENLMIQFLYPEKPLPLEYLEAIDTIDHSVIAPAGCLVNADVVVFEDWEKFKSFKYTGIGTFVIRTDLERLIENKDAFIAVLHQLTRINVVLTDIAHFKEENFVIYDRFLSALRKVFKDLYLHGHQVQCNLITDRIDLGEMNNCNAGIDSITLAPNGKLYLCPGFYYDGEEAVGNLYDGINIKNKQLLQLDHAPLCRICDAYQCKRCIWFNKNTTLEVNTPSHEQCVIAHLERNQSRNLLIELQDKGFFDKKQKIKEISYLDPFDVKEEW